MISIRSFYAAFVVLALFVLGCANSSTVKDDPSKTPADSSTSEECRRPLAEGEYTPWECLPPEVRNRKYPPASESDADHRLPGR